MKKKLIRLTETDLHNIIKEVTSKVLNEIGDTRRGQYMLGKLFNKKYEGNYNDNPTDAFNQAKPIMDYARKNNTKGMEGSAAFDTGEHATFNKRMRQFDTDNKGKSRRRSEEEILNTLQGKDQTENNIPQEDIKSFSYNWLINHTNQILRYTGGEYTKDTLIRNGCKNLGEYIVKLSESGHMPGWTFYQLYMKKIYKELGLYFDNSMIDNKGFKQAWEEFCEYVTNHS